MENQPDRARIALWVAALRDPEARQAKKTLTRADGSGDCCLGIACKVAIANGLDLATDEGSVLIGNGSVKAIAYGGHGEKSFLPVAACEWYGLFEHDPIVGLLNGIYTTATQANDHHGLTFAEIADMLEKHYLSPDVEPVTV